MASMATSDLEDSIDISVFEQSSPESLRPRTISPSVHGRTSSGPTLHELDEDDYFASKGLTSTRSSISSFPSSVIHTIQFTDNEDYSCRTPSRTQYHQHGRSSSTRKPPSNSYLSAFRHPSSVRALQLESEYADSDAYSISRSPRHERSPRAAYFGPRSPGSTQSSPTKRSSRPGTPQQKKASSKLKKEFPLVLLHCTLLPPATTLRASMVSEEILEAVLPEQYRKSWRTLQDKVVKNNEVKQRGVLIAHPRDDYDLLEERLLEALELERPRIRRGHYIGTSKSGSDSGFESSSQNDTDEGSEVDEQDDGKSRNACPDCGKNVSCKTEQDRRWEVKIFAANGLMRSGAWSAAWEQMEKIDVEVAVWMPEDVRFEVEERLKALQAKEEAERPVEEAVESPKKKRTRSNTARLRHDERMREIYGEPEKTPMPEQVEETRQTVQPEVSKAPNETPNLREHIATNTEHILPEIIFTNPQFVQHEVPPQTDFFTYIKHHFRVIINDQRNLAIVLLSIMVLFFSIQNLESNGKTATEVNDGTKGETTASIPSMNTPEVSMAASPIVQIAINSFEPVVDNGYTDMPMAEPQESDTTSLLEEYTHLPLHGMNHHESPNSPDTQIPEETQSESELTRLIQGEEKSIPSLPRSLSGICSVPLLFTYDTCRSNEEYVYES